MRRQTLALVVVGLLLFIAGGAIAFVTVEKGAKNHSGTPTVAPPASVSAVVVTGDVAAGTTGKDLVAKGLVALKLIPHKQFVSTDLTNLQGLTDEVLTTSLTKGQAIATTDLIPSTTAISLPTGLDAVSITVTGTAGLAGYLEPGSNVDLYGNVTKLSQIPGSAAPVPANTPIPCTELLMTNVEVLDVSNTVPPYTPPSSTSVATGTASSTGRSVPSTLTVLLALTPSQSQTVTFMAQNETLSVAQTQAGTTPPALGVCVGTGVVTAAP